MRIACATPGDVPSLVEIWHQGWHQAHAAVVPPALVASRTSAEFEARTRAHLVQTRVMWADQEIAGFFMLDGDELYQFYVAQSFQGRGVARKLMSAAEASLGAGRKWLACSVGNTHAAGFYEACGWVHVSTTPYEVETAQGRRVVRVWRYEKELVIQPNP